MNHAISSYTSTGRRWATRRFRTDDAANAFMVAHPEWSVIYAGPGVIHLARTKDTGKPIISKVTA